MSLVQNSLVVMKTRVVIALFVLLLSPLGNILKAQGDGPALTAAGDAAFKKRDFTGALASYEKAAGLIDKNQKPVEWAVAQSLVANALVAKRERVRSLALLEEVLSIYGEKLAPNDPRIFDALTNLAILYRMVGRPGDAEPLLVRAVELGDKLYGPTDPRLIAPVESLAQILGNTMDLIPKDSPHGRLNDATTYYRQVLAIEDAQHYEAKDPEELERTLDGVAAMLNATDRTEEALPFYRRALVLRQKQGDGGPDPHVYGQLYVAALQKCGWSKDRIEADLKAVQVEAEKP